MIPFHTNWNQIETDDNLYHQSIYANTTTELSDLKTVLLPTTVQYKGHNSIARIRWNNSEKQPTVLPSLEKGGVVKKIIEDYSKHDSSAPAVVRIICLIFYVLNYCILID